MFDWVLNTPLFSYRITLPLLLNTFAYLHENRSEILFDKIAKDNKYLPDRGTDIFCTRKNVSLCPDIAPCPALT